MATEATQIPAPLRNVQIIEQLGRRYEAGFITEIESDYSPPG